MTFAGQSDWRLPNIRELQTIVDSSVVNPAIDVVAFSNASGQVFWSSTAYAPGSGSGSAWGVNFSNGSTDINNKTATLVARLVRGGLSSPLLNVARPGTDYVDHGNGTITHTPTGLMWQRCAIGLSWTGSNCTGTAGKFTWDEANLLASASTWAGKASWRLPSREELLSMPDYSLDMPSVNSVIFPATPMGTNFWTASNYLAAAGFIWIMGEDGSFYGNGNEDLDFVRLVRNGRSFGPWLLSVSISAGVGKVSSSTMPGIECGTLCSGGYNPGTVVTLNATPGANFISWGGACSGSTPTCTVTMDAARSVTASFKAVNLTPILMLLLD